MKTRTSLPKRLMTLLRGWWASFEFPGIIAGWLLLYTSLTPSLLPRGAAVQGVLSGISAAVGYGIGVGGHAVWRYLELPKPSPSSRGWIVPLSTVVMTTVLGYFLFNLVRWQNDLREIFGMDPIDDRAYVIVVVGVAVPVAAALVGLARALRRLVRALGRLGGRIVPRRVGRVLGYATGLLLVTAAASGLLLDVMVGIANRGFSVQNGIVDADVPVPESSLRSGGPESLIEWETMGAPGRRWVARGPTADQIDEVTGGGALEPIRAYVGIDSAPTLEERAQLLLDELIRTGAFDRKVLVLATSTGSGGLDPRGTGVVEFMHNGDTAIAGMQYSFLPSWISYFVDQAVAKEAATVVFETIHDHWRDLDPDRRPEFYLFGVSLGSYGSESSATSIRASGDPIDGAVWAGPTFNNEEWVGLTRRRDQGSPEWLPVYDEGSVVRFTSRVNALDEPTGEWESNRYVYIQHGSDPVTFFSPSLLLHEPGWLRGERSPQVSKHMNWYPVVTFWQVLLDLPAGGSVPPGYGHNFGTAAYLDAWAAVTEPDGWTDVDRRRVLERFEGPGV